MIAGTPERDESEPGTGFPNLLLILTRESNGVAFQRKAWDLWHWFSPDDLQYCRIVTPRQVRNVSPLRKARDAKHLPAWAAFNRSNMQSLGGSLLPKSPQSAVRALVKDLEDIRARYLHWHGIAGELSPQSLLTTRPVSIRIPPLSPQGFVRAGVEDLEDIRARYLDRSDKAERASQVLFT